MKDVRSFVGIVALSSVGIAARLMVHQPNFAPITALALIAGYYLPKKTGWLVPLLAVLISDCILGFYAWPVMAAVYGSYLASWALARWAQTSGSRSALLPATLISSVLFFLVTNGAVWAFTPLYAKTWLGLYDCYAMAVPFFRSTLLSDVFYTTAFVALISLARTLPARQASIAYESNQR